VHGLNSVAGQHSVREIVSSARVDIVCLQEIKMPAISCGLILSMLGREFDSNFIFLSSAGASGGVLIAWRESLDAAGASRIDNYCVSVQFCPANRELWWMTCVYGPQGNEEKINFLLELRHVCGLSALVRGCCWAIST
jgi:exonuclease III